MITGVALGFGVELAVGQLQSLSPVQDGFRQLPLEQVRPEAQSALLTQLELQLASGVAVGEAVGLAVGEAVGLAVGEAVGLGLGVGVGQPQLDSALHSGLRQKPPLQVSSPIQSVSSEHPELQLAGVGLGVGEAVGDAVGEAVGLAVGEAVAVTWYFKEHFAVTSAVGAQYPLVHG